MDVRITIPKSHDKPPKPAAPSLQTVITKYIKRIMFIILIFVPSFFTALANTWLFLFYVLILRKCWIMDKISKISYYKL